MPKCVQRSAFSARLPLLHKAAAEAMILITRLMVPHE